MFCFSLSSDIIFPNNATFRIKCYILALHWIKNLLCLSSNSKHFILHICVCRNCCTAIFWFKKISRSALSLFLIFCPTLHLFVFYCVFIIAIDDFISFLNLWYYLHQNYFLLLINLLLCWLFLFFFPKRLLAICGKRCLRIEKFFSYYSYLMSNSSSFSSERRWWISRLFLFGWHFDLPTWISVRLWY